MGEGKEHIPLFEDDDEEEDEEGVENIEGLGSDEEENEGEKRKRDKDKGRQKRSRVDAMSTKKRGVCYLSRIPRHMDHVKLRQILSQYGEVERIYLVPENPAAQMSRKRAGGYRGTEFSEGWIEFTKKRIAKKVAKLLNGQQMGGKRRSTFYYDLWNIKYLRKFKWDDLTEEIAYKNAIREQKLALELSAAKRERDFYLSKVDQSRALSSMQERVRKKQKAEDKEPNGSDADNNEIKPKIIRRFPQNRPIVSLSTQRAKPRLSNDILAGVFGGSSA